MAYSPSTEAATRGVLSEKTLVLVFSGEFSKLFKNTFFTEHLRVTVSASGK